MGYPVGLQRRNVNLKTSISESAPVGIFNSKQRDFPFIIRVHKHHMPPGMPEIRDVLASEAYSLENRYSPDPEAALRRMVTSYCVMHTDMFGCPNGVRRPALSAPSMYSVAFTEYGGPDCHFGISAPKHGGSRKNIEEVNSLRYYRLKRAYQNTKAVPADLHGWKPGNCAEAQSLPTVIERACQYIEKTGKEAVVYSLAIDKSSTKRKMCRNCVHFARAQMEREPKLRVVDVVYVAAVGYLADSIFTIHV